MPAEGEIRRGFSMDPDAARAARAFHAAVAQPEQAGLVVFFCSPAYDLDVIAAEFADRFGDAPVVGCTTAGEIGPGGYAEGSITGFSLPARDCCAAVELIADLADFQMARGHQAADRVMAALARRSGQAADKRTTFAMLLSDGMSTNEEALVASLQHRLGDVGLLGGSAGDDLRLRQTFVYCHGRFHPNAALLTLIHTTRPFRIYRCQHYAASGTRMVVTQADPAARRVQEINAEPAAVEYARIIGLDPRQLTPAIFAEFPVMVRVGGDYYVRSIQRRNDDASLTFFCAIDQGVVLTLGRHQDIVQHLAAFFEDVRAALGPPELVIGFDCILRRLEAEARQARHSLSRILRAGKVIGFSTYGEQFHGMHVNQTFTAVALGRPPPA